MSYQIVDKMLHEGSFTPEDKLVMIALSSYADNDSREAWPSVETLAFDSSLSRRTVQRTLRRLERLGVIHDVTVYQYFDKTEKTRKRATKFGGAQNVTHYRIAEDEVIHKIMFKDFCSRVPRKRKQRPTDALEQRPTDALTDTRTASVSHLNSVTQTEKCVPQSPNSVCQTDNSVPQTHESVRTCQGIGQLNLSVEPIKAAPRLDTISEPTESLVR